MFPENPNAVWAANGEFSMSAERAREVVWALGGGQTGIVGPESLAVRAADTPDGTVRVRPGVFTMAATPEHLFMQTGYTSAPWQSYMRGVYQTQEVEINPTGSSGGRIDVVGIEINDPQYEGNESPDWENHQFWRIRVLEGANQGWNRPHHFGHLGRPFLPLARINIPANTGTITNSMITDLRFMAVRREDTQEFLEPANPGSGNLVIGPDQTDWLSLPEVEDLPVPQWATHVQLKAALTSARVTGSGTMSGQVRLQFTADTGWQSTEPTIIRADGSFNQINFQAAGRVALDYDGRNTGRPARVRMQIRRAGGSANLTIPNFSDHTSWVDGRVIFEESPRTSS